MGSKKLRVGWITLLVVKRVGMIKRLGSINSFGEEWRPRLQDMAKAMVAEHISQAVQSTSNLLHLIQQSSTSQTQLMKLPKNLLAKTSAIKNTGHLLEQMPQVVSSLDAHLETGLHRCSSLGIIV